MYLYIDNIYRPIFIIHSKSYIAPLQGNSSEALPTQVWTKGRFSNDLEMYRHMVYGTGTDPEGDHSIP